MKGTPCRRLTPCRLVSQRSHSRRVGTLPAAGCSSVRSGEQVDAISGNNPRGLWRQPYEKRAVFPTNPILGLQQVRGKKTKTSVRLEDLPQGPLVPLPTLLPPPSSSPSSSSSSKAASSFGTGTGTPKAPLEGRNDAGEEGGEGDEEGESEPAYPTVVLQARRNMRKFDSCVLLTRVGGFYELYFEHAEEYGPLLNLKVAQKKTSAGPVPMAGFPFFQLERFLKTLVLDLNSYVAIAEEFPNDPSDRIKSGGLMHDRRVTRIITSGTLIDENFIDPYANNYVMAIHLNQPEQEGTAAPTPAAADPTPGASAEPVPADAPIGLAWLDISTGQFYTQATTVSSLPSILTRVAPREIVVDEILESRKDHNLFSVLAEDKQHLITFAPQGDHLPLAEWTPMLESEIPAQAAQSFTPDEVAAGSTLLQYVRNRLLLGGTAAGTSSSVMKLQAPQRHAHLAVMAIDRTTMRSLEIKQTLRDGVFRGSLLHAVRGTVTKGGARLLSAWLSAPSTSLETIRARQDLVEAFVGDDDLRDGVVLLLRRCHDSQRLVQKFAFGRGDADDMIALANTIQSTQDIVSLLGNHSSKHGGEAKSFESLLSRITLGEPAKLAARIRASIDEEGLVLQHQNEDSEASELVALAEDVVAAEEGEGSSQPSTKKGTTAAATAKRRRPTSIREHYFAAAGDDSNIAFIMKPRASPGLRKLHAELGALLREKAELGETLRERYDAPSLTLKWTPNLGHIMHVKGKDMRKINATAAATTTTRARARRTRATAIEDGGEEGNGEAGEQQEKEADDNGDGDGDGDVITAVSSSRSTRALHLPEWTRLGQRIHRARFEIAAEERRLFGTLRALVVRNLVKLRRNAAALDELDVLASSFARLASQAAGGGGGSWTRPVLDDSTSHSVIGGRHPTVEAGLRERGRTFTKNDCLVGSSSSSSSSSSSPSSSSSGSGSGSGSGDSGRLWLITGPNMAGKSTYLRQNALITILAQAGSWVPADHARLGVVDAIYSRVGSAGGDSLHQDQSTFMVEMVEAAQILRRATPRSLVVMDEVGRGTTARDGAAVAFAALHHLAAVNRCRALFATHFHELADWAEERGMLVLPSDNDDDDNSNNNNNNDNNNNNNNNDNGGGAAGGGVVDAYCTDVAEDGAGGFVYVHKLKRGVNRRSHALKVARLAGLPEAAITVAREILEEGSAGSDEMKTSTNTKGQDNDDDELD